MELKNTVAVQILQKNSTYLKLTRSTVALIISELKRTQEGAEVF